MKTHEKWQIFLETVTKSDSIFVERVTDDEVIFTSGTDTDLQALTTVFSSKELIRQNVIVALRQGTDQDSAPKPPLKARSPLLDLSGQEILAKLFTNDFFESIEFNPATLLDNPLYRTATLVVSEASPIRLKRALTTYELMQSALSNPALVSSILNGNTKAISQEPKTGEITDFGKSVISIASTSLTSASVVFNYGFLQAFMQNQYGVGMGDSPIIAASATQVGRFTLKKDALLRFVHDALSSNLIFSEEDGELRPVVFKERQAEVSNPASLNLHMLLDVSDSMKPSFDEYRNKIKETIKKIAEASKEWTITLTAFNSETHSQTFSTSKANDIDDLFDFIDNLNAEKYTNLNGAVFNALQNLSLQQQSSALVVFTDGDDTEKKKTDQEVAVAALNLRKQNDQFMMFSLGFGKSYNQTFFNNLSEAGGFVHKHLDRIAQFSEFHQYIGSLNVKKVVFEFVTEAAKSFFMQCPEGDVAVSSNTVPVNAQVRHAGQAYEAYYRGAAGTIKVQDRSAGELHK